MKKVLSIILAAVLFMAGSFTAFAVEPEETTAAETTTAKQLVAADDVTVEDAFRAFEKIIVLESESKTDKAGEAMFSLFSIISEAGVTDYADLGEKMAKYAEANESEIEPCFSDMASVQNILKLFTTGLKFELTKAQKTIESGGSLSSLIALYTGAYIVKSAKAPEKAEDGKTTMVENPKTGDSPVKTAVAFAVFGLSVAAVAVCSKKKENE